MCGAAARSERLCAAFHRGSSHVALLDVCVSRHVSACSSRRRPLLLCCPPLSRLRFNSFQLTAHCVASNLSLTTNLLFSLSCNTRAASSAACSCDFNSAAITFNFLPSRLPRCSEHVRLSTWPTLPQQPRSVACCYSHFHRSLYQPSAGLTTAVSASCGLSCQVDYATTGRSSVSLSHTRSAQLGQRAATEGLLSSSTLTAVLVCVSASVQRLSQCKSQRVSLRCAILRASSVAALCQSAAC